MIGFIDSQTKWYTDRTARFKEIKIEILKCTPEGRYKLAMMRVKALEKCQQVFKMAGAFMLAFGQNIDLKPFQEASKALESINEIILEDARKKKEDLYKVQDAAVHMGKEDVQRMRPSYQVYPGVGYQEAPLEWFRNGNLYNKYHEAQAKRIQMEEENNRREGNVSGNMDGT